MRFRKRLSAAILAIVMMISSIQIPGGISYAAGLADVSMESGVDASILTAEETEDTGASEPEEGALTNDASQPGGGNVADNDSQPGGGNVADNDSQPGNDNASEYDNQSGGDNQLGDGSQPSDDNPTGDDNTAGDDSQTSDDGHTGDDTPTDDGNDPKQEADIEQEIDIELEPNEKIVSYSIEGISPFADIPEELDGRSSSATYNYYGEVFDYVYRQMMQHVEYIDLYEGECLEIEDWEYTWLMVEMRSCHPELWFVKDKYELVLEQVQDGGANVWSGAWHVKAIIVHYYENGEEYDFDAFDEKVREALSCVNDNMSDVEKVAALHDWLALNCRYDLSGPHCYDAYGALVDGRAVCEGYALAYRHLMDMIGIESYYVVSDTMNHGWNMVKLNDQYYHVDVTWDDSYGAGGYVEHDCLLFSENRPGGHTGWTVYDGYNNYMTIVDYKATDTTYDNAFWRGLLYPLFYGGGECYYISKSDRKLMKASLSNVSNPGVEIADGEFNEHSGLLKINDRLYYNGEYAIYSIKTDGTDNRTEFTQDPSEQYYMSGLWNNQGKIYYKTSNGWLPADIDIEPDINNSGEYWIMYRLNGGMNDSGNPGSYNSETETITLKAPTKEGYVFTGWYTDIHLNYEVTEIPKGSTGNIVLIAGWRPETDNPSYTFTTVDGQTVNSGADGRQKVLIFFDMSVSIYERTTARRMLMDLREHIGAFDGVDFYAIEISGKSSDEVAEFKENYGCEEITFCYDKDGSNKEYAKEYTNGNFSNLTVVIIDDKNRVQRVTNGMSRNWTGILKDLQEYCGYDNWYILYELDDGENHSGNPYIYQYGADDVILEDPFRGGYIFEGWYKDKTFTQQVTEIANDSRENFKLYAKWRKGEGLFKFVENDSFTSLDGMKFNTKAEGRPKLIVFYDDAAAESASVIQEISGIIDDLGWVDICAIDIGQNAKSREKVRQFADTYGCDGILFSYKAYTGSLNMVCMEKYLETAGIETSAADFPVICYIDAGSRFQWITLGKVSAEDILGNLKKYCLYSPRGEGEYRITYMLNGGKNNRENPMFYMPGTRDFILRDPFKAGHTFEGWYKDADFKEKITKIAGESTGDITIYAKWSAGVGLGYENYDIPFTALDGTTFSTKAEGRPRVVIFYDIAKEESTSTVRSIAVNINVLDGVDIYAVNVNKGPVNGESFKEGILDRDLVTQFKDDNGCDGITYSYMSCGNEWVSYKDYMAAYTKRAGYGGAVNTPAICYIDSEDNLQWVSQGKATVADVLSCLKNSCDYGLYEGDIYSVNYRMDGGTNDWRNPEVYLAGTQTIALRDPLKEGYTFEGWYKDPEFSVQVNQIAEGSTGDITFYARWKKGAPNPDYTFTTVDDETVSSKADGKPKLLLFFRQDSPNSQETSQDLSQHIKNFNGVDIYAIEAVNAKKEVVAQYKNVYGCDEITFCYDTSGKNMQCFYDYFDLARFSSEAGVPFIVYIDSQNHVQHADLGKRSFMEILTDLRDYCDYHYEDSEVIYNITYELNGVTDNSANPSTYTPGTETIVLKEAVKDGYTFEGWYNDAGFSEKVTEIVKGSTGDITLYAKWKEIPVEPTYRIIYELSGGTNSSENPATYTAATETITLADAVREGYKFKGWYKDSEYTQKVTQIPKGSTGDIKLYAKWLKKQEGLGTANLDKTFTALDDTILSSRADGRPKLLVFTCKVDERDTYASSTVESISQSISDFAGVDIYVIDYGLNSKEYVSNYKAAYGCDEMKFAYDTTNGTRSIVVDYLKAAGKQTLWTTPPVICYIDEHDILQCITQGRLNAETILNNLDIYCNYTPEECNPLPTGTYKITYNLDGGTNSSENPATYTSETETITLKNAVKEGFIFEGWYKDAEFTENSKLTEIVKGSKGDIALYAKWKKAEMNVSIQKPDKTTYKIGQTLDVTGGKVILTGKSDESVKIEKDITLAMISGFDSSAASICKVMVTCDGYTGNFDVLIVEEPEITAFYGQKIKDISLPESDYGTYTWADGVDTEKVLNQTGTQTFEAVFTPNDTDKFNILEGLQISVAVKTALSPEYVQIECLAGPYTYNKTDIEPEVKVTLSRSGNTDGEETLVEGTDYELTYENNINAGTAKLIVTGINSYFGRMEKTFTIEPKELVIRALDKVILIGSSIPTEYEYDAEGLVEGDKLIKAPEFTCAITSTEEEGEYEIVPKEADAGENYRIIRYENSILHVVSELVTCKVIFNMQGHGTAPTGYAGIPVGSTIGRPADPNETGYRFDGWYQDAACTKAWNFETDIVQSDITLYAKWLGIGVDSDLAVQEIADVYYNGKAQKPVVSVYDQDKLLKAGKDYQIKYYNNINANADGVRSKSGEFNDKLPYVEITGKGNYKDSVKINFNILKSPIEDAYGNPAPGVRLKVNDHLGKSAKPLTPFGSINYGKKLKADTDYELILTSLNVHDDSGNLVNSETYLGAQIPANYTGEFLLTVKGKGNYTGSITRSVYVADKNHLMKNVKITLGKNLKNVEYTGESIEFTPADKQKPGNDEFVVTCGKTVLTPNEDYSVSYNNNTGVGKAELVVVGKGEYVGKKSVTFNIKGKTFSNGTVDVTGLNDKAYTGRAITQNKEAVLKWKADGKELVYGTDYTISYSKNINKGTATVTFTGMAEGGYSGKVIKKFKITAADISDETRVTRAVSMQTITLPYSKAGVKPVDEIIMTSAGGTRLQSGKDYTLKYKNNKAVANASGDKAPTVTVKGKGNYSGTFDVKFTIDRADLNGSGIVIECAPVAYNSKKADDYAYKPAIKVKDGKAALKAGKDYEISYVNNTRADYNNYLEKLKSGNETADDIPVAVITEKEGSAYTVQGSIRVPLQIYMTKFTKSNLDVEIDTVVYTGGQVKPNVTVKYKGEGGDILLEKGVDYTLEYGANSASGKNKGSVTIKGLVPEYGGSVTYKFDITRKDLKYGVSPVIDEK